MWYRPKKPHPKKPHQDLQCIACVCICMSLYVYVATYVIKWVVWKWTPIIKGLYNSTDKHHQFVDTTRKITKPPFQSLQAAPQFALRWFITLELAEFYGLTKPLAMFYEHFIHQHSHHFLLIPSQPLLQRLQASCSSWRMTTECCRPCCNSSCRGRSACRGPRRCSSATTKCRWPKCRRPQGGPAAGPGLSGPLLCLVKCLVKLWVERG